MTKKALTKKALTAVTPDPPEAALAGTTVLADRLVLLDHGVV